MDFKKGVWVQEMRSKCKHAGRLKTEGERAAPQRVRPFAVLKADGEGAEGHPKQGSIL